MRILAVIPHTVTPGSYRILLRLVNNYIPMQATIKKILNAVVVIAVVLWLLNVFGVLDSLSNIRIGA